MAQYDIFNGDADGIISLLQLRLAEPREAIRITGVKRDIALLSQVQHIQAGDRLTVLDISMRNNAQDLKRILQAGAYVLYMDHHTPGERVEHTRLEAVIDCRARMCTAILVDQRLQGAYRAWAVTAAFGDNLADLAHEYAQGYNLPLATLQKLGELVNYNAYGTCLSDLHFHPADLYAQMLPYACPIIFMKEKIDIYQLLEEGYLSDMEQAQAAKILSDKPAGQVLCLTDCAASRRISGLFGNQLAHQNPTRAHAILTAQKGGFLVSIRAPLIHRHGADQLAMSFATGGGRAAAAGINHLPENDVTDFIDAFHQQWS